MAVLLNLWTATLLGILYLFFNAFPITFMGEHGLCVTPKFRESLQSLNVIPTFLVAAINKSQDYLSSASDWVKSSPLRVHPYGLGMSS
jgi:hypothetical protein